MNYQKNDILRLAKRLGNTRRTYLLVNPLQGKHIPVRPSASLEMMACLGSKLRGRFPDARLVIGFAETATAVGAAVAACFGGDCAYVHTTREEVPGAAEWVHFQEEHSHAVEQKLCADHLRQWIAATPQVVLVDDELSTGKTILNMTAQMRRTLPELRDKEFVAASVINRLSPENEKRLRDAGVVCEWLLHLPEEDYTETVRGFQTVSPVDLRSGAFPEGEPECFAFDLRDADPRRGVMMGAYHKTCGEILDGLMPRLRDRLGQAGRVLVLGTEEFMYLPLLLARRIERDLPAASVSFHATTRSPIETGQPPEYPLFNGYRIASFYEDERDTFVYDLADYDAAVVMTDAGGRVPAALSSLAEALRRNGCGDLLVMRGGGDV